jgi:hypothetical protein
MSNRRDKPGVSMRSLITQILENDSADFSLIFNAFVIRGITS